MPRLSARLSGSFKYQKTDRLVRTTILKITTASARKRDEGRLSTVRKLPAGGVAGELGCNNESSIVQASAPHTSNVASDGLAKDT